MTLEQALETLCLHVSDLSLHSVKQQYYRLARKVHPDKGGSNEMMQNLTIAKEFLEKYLASAPSTQVHSPKKYTQRKIRQPSWPNPRNRTFLCALSETVKWEQRFLSETVLSETVKWEKWEMGTVVAYSIVGFRLSTGVGIKRRLAESSDVADLDTTPPRGARRGGIRSRIFDTAVEEEPISTDPGGRSMADFLLEVVPQKNTHKEKSASHHGPIRVIELFLYMQRYRRL